VSCATTRSIFSMKRPIAGDRRSIDTRRPRSRTAEPSDKLHLSRTSLAASPRRCFVEIDLPAELGATQILMPLRFSRDALQVSETGWRRMARAQMMALRATRPSISRARPCRAAQDCGGHVGVAARQRIVERAADSRAGAIACCACRTGSGWHASLSRHPFVGI